MAFDRETCAGKPMYGAVEWYYPEHGEHFDPTHHEDICRGQYVDLTCLSSVQASAVLRAHLGTRRYVAFDSACSGSSWAVAIVTKNGASTKDGGTPLGSAVFHRVPGGPWAVAASFVDGGRPTGPALVLSGPGPPAAPSSVIPGC